MAITTCVNAHSIDELPMPKNAQHVSGLRICFTAIYLVAVIALGVTAGHASELRHTAIVRAVRTAIPSVVNIHGQKTSDSSASICAFLISNSLEHGCCDVAKRKARSALR